MRQAYRWPSMATIAARSAISVRQAKRLIHALEEAGHVEIEPGNGRKHPNRYRMLCSLNSDARDTVLSPQTVTPETLSRDKENGDISGETVTPRVRNGDKVMSPEPSRNHNNNRQGGGAEQAQLPASPADAGSDDSHASPAVIAVKAKKPTAIDGVTGAWASHPELPQIRNLSEKRRKAIAVRLRMISLLRITKRRLPS